MNNEKPSTRLAPYFIGGALLGLLAGLVMGLGMSGQFAFALGIALPVAAVFSVAGGLVGLVVKMLRR